MASIVSSIPGRIRIRDKTFADAGRCERLRDAFLALDGVAEVETRPDASSLIVHYDAAAVSPEHMESLADEMIDAEIAASRGKRARSMAVNRAAKIGMLASLATSLVLAASGARRAHAITGGLFVGCLGLHLLTHRHKIIA